MPRADSPGGSAFWPVPESGEPRRSEPPPWLKLARPDSTARIRVRPLTLGGVHALISKASGPYPAPSADHSDSRSVRW